MIMKKIVLLFLVLCNCLVCNAAGISKEVLTANKWVVVTPDYHGRQIHTITIHNDDILEWNVNFVVLNKFVTSFYRYYLTDQMPSKFDIDKVGKADSGLYLVFANIKDLEAKDNFFICYEVISEDKNAVEFRDRFGQFWRLEKQ